MQQRQLRLGDILDDYCPRERRVTNHAVVAMLGSDVKQTRCTTCDAEHEYKNAKVRRQRRKWETPAGATGSNGVHQEEAVAPGDITEDVIVEPSGGVADVLDEPPQLATETGERADSPEDTEIEDNRGNEEEGPVHRPLIRASLPRHEGQPPPTRPIPEFTIRQPAGRQNRFRPRHQRGPAVGGPEFA